MRNTFVRGTLASLKSSVIVLLYRSRGSAISELENLNAIRVIRSWGGRGQGATFTAKGKVGVGAIMNSNQNNLTHADLCH